MNKPLIKIEVWQNDDNNMDIIIGPGVKNRHDKFPFTKEQWQEVINRMIEFKDNYFEDPYRQVRFLNDGYNTMI